MTASVLQGIAPSLSRYAETLADGREVFLAVVRPGSALPGGGHLPGWGGRHPAVLLRIIVIAPDGSWADGPPVIDPSGGGGGSGCSDLTRYAVEPNAVGRIRWQFARQDQYGYVYRRPLTVQAPVRGNVVVAIIRRASCEKPNTTTLYGHDGQVLHETGRSTNLDRITRPVRPGRPGTVFHEPSRR